MSAAFALSPSGPPAPCGYPKCTLEAFHEGDHQFEPADKRVGFEFGAKGPRHFHCVVCGREFLEYGDYAHPVSSVCDSPYCLAHYRVRRCGGASPLLCGCPQRPYAHELAIHTLLRGESFNPKLKYRWPWSLMLSRRVEPGTESENGKF